MRLPKVILVHPPIEDFYLTAKRTLPYGLAAIAGPLAAKGFDVDIIDGLARSKSKKIPWPAGFDYLKPYYPQKDISLFSLFYQYTHFGYSYEYIGRQVRDQRPFVVGVSSLFTAYADQALETARIIKKCHPECTLVLGGHHPTQFPEHVLAYPFVDIVLRGEGEQNMALLCTALKNGAPLDEIPGIAFRNKGRTVIKPPDWINDFSSIPVPLPDRLNWKHYQRRKRCTAVIVSSRGCPMPCTYCAVSASSSYASYRKRPVDHVVAEVEKQLDSRDIGFIDFEDENLCLDKDWFTSLFQRLNPLLSGKNIELRAMNGLYPAGLDEQTVSILKSSGFKTLNLSLGSASRKQLKSFKRPDIIAAYEKALMLAQKYDLECVSYIIAAAPGQTAQSSLKDLFFLAPRQTLIGLSIYYPAPGSLDYTRCKKQNILPDGFPLMRSSAFPLDDSTSRLEAVTLLRLSRILNFMKSIVDNERSLPLPEKFSPGKPLPPADRYATSIQLLKWFLNDGNIRGVSPDGQVFSHYCDTVLTRTFITHLQGIRICGVKKRG